MTRSATLCLALALTSGNTCAQTVAASDDFDNPVNLVSYAAIDAEGNDPTNTGVWSSPRDNFGPRETRDAFGGGTNFLSETLIDESTSTDVFDTIGILTPDYDGFFFAICDTDNGVNPSGVVEGAWTFDISGAGELSKFSIDIAAVGNWFDDGQGLFERFNFFYSIDGGTEVALFTIRGDTSAGPVTYTLDNGTSFTVNANGVDANGATINGQVILNELTPIEVPISGSGDTLVFKVVGFINDNNAGLIFDNIVFEAGPSPCNAADIALPFEVLDLADIDAFIAAFLVADDLADIAPPAGIVDLGDIDAFIASFLGGCP